MQNNIRKGGEIVICTKCGAAARTLDCRKGFEPSIKCIDSIDGGAWEEMAQIIKKAREVYEGYPAELDAINYIYQSLEAAKR